MKPISNSFLTVTVIKEADGTYSCDQSYEAISNTLEAGGPVIGNVIDKSVVSGRSGASSSSIYACGVQPDTSNKKIGIRYYACSFNTSTGAVSGNSMCIYMAPDGTMSTTP